MHSSAIDTLREEHDVLCAWDAKEDVLLSTIGDREVLIFRSGVRISRAVLEAARVLKLILRAGSGVDNIDLDYVLRNGPKMVRIPGPGAKAVAEMSFAMMLALARNLREADRLTRERHWAKSEMMGHLLTGKTLGIIGVGNIGELTGRRGVAWGMNVIGCNETLDENRASALRAVGIELRPFEEVLARADYLSLHVPLTAATRHLIDASAIARMKPRAYLINLARGHVVDEIALREALLSGHLAGAGVDVHAKEGGSLDSPLADLPNVILTPHIGASAFEAQQEIGEIVVETIRRFACAPQTFTEAVSVR